jgi:hypothetical protein
MSHSFLLQAPSNTHESKSTYCDALKVGSCVGGRVGNDGSIMVVLLFLPTMCRVVFVSV